jgi:hypothetical protein
VGYASTDTHFHPALRELLAQAWHSTFVPAADISWVEPNDKRSRVLLAAGMRSRTAIASDLRLFKQTQHASSRGVGLALLNATSARRESGKE